MKITAFSFFHALWLHCFYLLSFDEIKMYIKGVHVTCMPCVTNGGDGKIWSSWETGANSNLSLFMAALLLLWICVTFTLWN